MLLVTILIGFASSAEGKSIAVVDVTNSYFKESDKFYGDSTTFRNNVAALTSIMLGEIEGLESQDYVVVREKAAKYLGGESDLSTLTLDKEQALAFAKAEGYDYIVLADVLEARVKTSKKGFGGSLMGKKKYSIWNVVEINVYDVANGNITISGKYEGKHQKSKNRSFLSYYFAGTGVKTFDPKMEKMNINPLEFGQSDLGIPFVRVCEQFNDELAEKFGLKIKIEAEGGEPEPAGKDLSKTEEADVPPVEVKDVPETVGETEKSSATTPPEKEAEVKTAPKPQEDSSKIMPVEISTGGPECDVTDIWKNCIVFFEIRPPDKKRKLYSGFWVGTINAGKNKGIVSGKRFKIYVDGKLLYDKNGHPLDVAIANASEKRAMGYINPSILDSDTEKALKLPGTLGILEE